MKRYLVSWEEPGHDWRPANPPSKSLVEFWACAGSGWYSDIFVMCASVLAADSLEAKQIIEAHWKPNRFLSCSENNNSIYDPEDYNGGLILEWVEERPINRW